MLKWIGSIIIIMASTGIGLAMSMEFQRRLSELQDLKQLFLMLKSEIKYTKVPLGEAFLHIGRRSGGIYGTWLQALSKQLRERSGRTFQELWKQSVEQFLRDTDLKKTDLEQLESLGTNMGYLDTEMQLGTIDFYLEQLDVEIRRTREELSAKKKLCNCFGIMGGIFLVIVLI